jgi:asparagine synthase (glutamine-hydrolysing)
MAIQSCVYSKESWEGWDRHSLYSPETFQHLNDDLKTLEDRPLDGTGRVPADTLNQMLLADQDGYLAGDLLPKTDYATMSASLEARAPFLDHQLAEVAGQLPIHLKATASQTKVALRQLSEKYLPDSLVKRPKRGFGVPLNDWFRGPLKKWLRETLIESSQTVPRYFRRDVVASVIDAHSQGEKNLSGKIHALLSFELWHRHYGDQ